MSYNRAKLWAHSRHIARSGRERGNPLFTQYCSSQQHGNAIAFNISSLVFKFKDKMISLQKCSYFAVGLISMVGCLDTLRAQTSQLVTTPGQIVFNVQQGAIPAPQTLQVNTSNSQTVPFTIQATTSNGGQWLLFSQQTGNTPAQVLISANSAGLQPGTYNGAITITSGNVTNSPVSVPVILNVGSQFTVSPTSVAFSYQSGGAIPAAQSLAINSTGVAVPFSASATTTTGGTWLLLNPTSGTTPGSVSLSVNPSGLAAGTYNGVVHLASNSPGTSGLDVPVSLVVSASPTLSAAPSAGLNFSYQTGTTVPAAQTLTFSTNGAPIAFNVSPQTNNGGNWLVLSSFSGQATQSTPQVITVTPNVSGLQPGTYTGKVTVSAPGAANQSFDIPVSLLVSTNPLLQLGAAPAAFNYQLGGALPVIQTVQVNSSSTALPFNVSVTTTGGIWLTVTPISGTTPQALTLSASPQNLAPGQYTGTVSVTSPNAGNSPQSFAVTLNVSATTMLNASISSLTFNFQTTTLTPPQTQVVQVTSTGVPLNYTVASSTSTCGNNWLNVLPSSGTTPSSFSVAVSTAGITPQTCTGSISITSPGASNTITIPVAFNVSANPLLNIAPSNLSFSAPFGGTTLPQPAVISLSSTDPNTVIPFTVASGTTSGGNWLFVSSGTGNTPNNISVTVNPTGLTPGTYSGQITITSPNLPAAQVIPVTFTITSNVTATATPANVAFTIPANATVPVTQQVQITTSGTGALTFSASATTIQGGNWLTVSAPGGTTPGAITLSANATGLSQGVYNGQVTIQIPGASNSPLTIPVTLTVGPPNTIVVNNATFTFTSPAGATTNPATQAINVTSAGAPVNFTATVATTTCGNFLTATPTSGTTPATITLGVNVASLPIGTCNGTVTIGAPGIAPQVVNVTLTVTQAAVPQITAVVNAASSNPGSIAPGEIVTIYGANMGTTTLTTFIFANNSFATTVAGTQVLFDGIFAPIVYVRNDQLSVVVPFEVAGRPTVNIQVRYNGQTSAAFTQRVVDTAPGVFTTNQQGSGQGAIVNENGQVNGPGNPAGKGRIVAIYLTGGGVMSVGNTTGGVSPVTPLPTLPTNVPVTVTIGGQAAQVQYAGGAPGAIAGLYQINAVIPANIDSGTQPVVVNIGGVPAQGNVTLTVQ